MLILIIAAIVFAFVFLHNYSYKRLWQKGLGFNVKFSVKEAFEGDSIFLREELVNNAALTSETIAKLKERHSAGNSTINDIVDELKKPNRDPRDSLPKPVMQKGVTVFEDLKEGMMITGKIKNVVDFGAFVDLGIKETSLVHISELSDNFVKDPLDVVKVGDVLEFRIIALDRDRRRISLSRKSDKPVLKTPPVKAQPHAPAAALPTASTPTAKKTPAAGKADNGKAAFSKPAAANTASDGIMANAFAEAFKKMEDKKKNGKKSAASP